MKKNTALIVVDVQFDFCPGGALAIKNGDEVVPVINKLIDGRRMHGDSCAVYTFDWHPFDHVSFKKWPRHCVQFTKGAMLHKALKIESNMFFFKGFEKEVECYSGFGGVMIVGDHMLSLEDYLRTMGMKRVIIVGLATDYCVKATAIDAVSIGFETIVYRPGCRAVVPDRADLEYEQMRRLKITVTDKI